MCIRDSPTTVKVNGNTVVTLDPGQGGQGGSAGGPALGGAGYPVGGDATAGDVTSVASWVTSGAGASGPFGGGGGARANRFELMAGMPAMSSKRLARAPPPPPNGPLAPAPEVTHEATLVTSPAVASPPTG